MYVHNPISNRWIHTSCKMSSSFGITHSSNEASLIDQREKKKQVWEFCYQWKLEKKKTQENSIILQLYKTFFYILFCNFCYKDQLKNIKPNSFSLHIKEEAWILTRNTGIKEIYHLFFLKSFFLSAAGLQLIIFFNIYVK